MILLALLTMAVSAGLLSIRTEDGSEPHTCNLLATLNGFNVDVGTDQYIWVLPGIGSWKPDFHLFEFMATISASDTCSAYVQTGVTNEEIEGTVSDRTYMHSSAGVDCSIEFGTLSITVKDFKPKDYEFDLFWNLIEGTFSYGYASEGVAAGASFEGRITDFPHSEIDIEILSGYQNCEALENLVNDSNIVSFTSGLMLFGSTIFF